VFATEPTRIVVYGVVGPRGDGYRVDSAMTAEEAQAYHAPRSGRSAMRTRTW
jgi:hypothetical protein